MFTLDHLCTGYRSRHRTHPVSTGLCGELTPGALTCLLGTNGAGKSTLLRTMAGLAEPLGGRVCIDGVPLGSLPPEERARRVAIVLTGRPETDYLRVGELVALGRTPYTGFSGRLSEADHAEVRRALRLTAIEGMERRPVRTLSDGECQRAMVARALAQSTPAILLDEPTAFLDFPAKRGLFTLLARLAHTEGKAVLVSTHDVELALRMADRIWLLSDTGLSEGDAGRMAPAVAEAFKADAQAFCFTTDYDHDCLHR